MSAVNNMLAKLDNALDQDYAVNKYLDMIQQKTNIKKRYIALGVIGFLSIWLVYGYAADLLCNLIGFAYPAYVSVKAIESPDKDDDTAWLIYWVVFSVFSVVEFFSDILLSWFPFYYLGKCIFLVWCMLPIQWNGSNILYYRFIKPFILRHEGEIDRTIQDAKESAKNAVSAGLSNVSPAQAAEVMSTVSDALSDDKKSN